MLENWGKPEIKMILKSLDLEKGSFEYSFLHKWGQYSTKDAYVGNCEIFGNLKNQ